MQSASTESLVTEQAAPLLSRSHLLLITFGRLVLVAAYRIIYPLLPFLSQHFQVNLQTVSALITVQVLASFVSPLGGTLSDARGERTTMSLALVLFCVGAFCCAVVSSFVPFLAGYVLIGLALALYQPAAQSFLSARTPYTRRGLVLGLYELSWSAAALLGVAPLMQLVQTTRSTVPVFWALLGVAVLALALIRLMLPAAPTGHARAERIAWHVLRLPPVLALLGLLVLALGSVDLLFVVQGEWLERSLGANAAQLGQVFGLMGVAELIGALGSTLFVDRIGKKRAVVGGYLLTALAALALPWSNGVWLLVLVLFFVFDMAFEFSIVSTFPLASELVPAVRGTVLALASTAVGIGRAWGATSAGLLFNAFGVGANGTVAAVLLVVGVLLCVRFVHEARS